VYSLIGTKINDFLDYHRSIDTAHRSILSYQSDLRKFKRWSPDTSIESIGPLDIAEFKRYLQKKGQKPNTINRALVTLTLFFDWAVEKGLVESNPASNVKYVKEVKTAPKSLSRREQLSFMRAVNQGRKIRDIAIATLLLHTGVRVTEMCMLDIKDIIIKERSGSVTVLGKGNKERTVPLNATIRNALREWLIVRGYEPGPLFYSQKGGRISPRSVERLVKKYAYHARLDGVTPHILRHTFCKSLIDAGVSIDRVAVLAGHESLDTTARYTRPTQMDLQKAVEKLEWE
jgi:site-specific recombinase XerD